ncbi:MarR family winged helix-turn-helix transcriptional regulator [uncultured Aquimarina sp.]|uniref:MarR family winged helix-turn-helix transcriptional regulator n=1 Tax=uncultured Aquimarina sp. TaxID=575652 RepID=UPI002639A422|nr:MarR family winged helix-turn-helix transcriptional regulator [uncultured Aquimarina sp.]
MEFSPSECISARIGILQRKINTIYRTYLSPLNISESQSSILLVINKSTEIGQSEIASILNLERSSLSRNMVRLEKNGWIEKNASYHPIWSLSNNGRKFMKTLLPAWENAMKEVDGIIGNKGWESFGTFEKTMS